MIIPDVRNIKFKLCLVGEGAVGKTCLIRRFVYNQFQDKYITTIGTIVSKKEITIQNPNNDGSRTVILLIWDIMGQSGFRKLAKQAYFYGTLGIIAVCDVTRKETMSELQGWMEAVHSVTEEEVPTIFLGNKSDLVDKQQIDLDDITDFASRYKKAEAYLSSARTGINVEHTFKTLSEKISRK